MTLQLCRAACNPMSHMPLEPDIIDKINKDFPSDTAPHAIRILDSANKAARIARCIVFLSAGKLEAVTELLKLAEAEDPDVIYAAEDEGGIQRRDFTMSFFIDSDEKRWIGSVLGTMEGSGYKLSSLKIVPVDDRVVNH